MTVEVEVKAGPRAASSLGITALRLAVVVAVVRVRDEIVLSADVREGAGSVMAGLVVAQGFQG